MEVEMSATLKPDQRQSADWQQLDSSHYLHPFTDFKALAQQGSQIITRAEGAYIYDSEGRQILDGMSGLWCCSLGYGHPARLAGGRPPELNGFQ